ncbi:MAG: FecR family protein [Saprospiraceae bacterium]|nr:FecR family protein [Saprospiraceae bacterium]MBK7525476.1 FecR family protein [Saprospiraceae bacterium]MBK8082052.1 FecR family protein [Saprospiraceae bacterium]MBK9044327.1 FecR family protein [Saprospiraceae bacterium]MBP6693671.1 FecR family protein [Saprospiraceae bacterium]
MNNELLQTFLDDHRFIEWVHSDFQKHDEYWSQFIDNQPDSHDTINKAIRIALALKGDKAVYEAKNQLFNRIENTINNFPSEQKETRIISVRRWMAYAASFILLLVSLVYFGGNKNINTGIGDSLTIDLPDNSKVSLNASASLRYNKFLWVFSRKVSLSGEAFFKVQKGSTFTVNTTMGNVAVLGTSFNVDHSNDKLDVKCYTGKVSVTNISELKSVILTQGKGVIMKKSREFLLFDVKKQNSPEWMEGREHFENVELQEVINKLQKYFDPKIEVETTCQNLKITAKVPINDLDSALQTITWPLGLHFKIQDKKVFITK